MTDETEEPTNDAVPSDEPLTGTDITIEPGETVTITAPVEEEGNP